MGRDAFAALGRAAFLRMIVRAIIVILWTCVLWFVAHDAEDARPVSFGGQPELMERR